MFDGYYIWLTDFVDDGSHLTSDYSKLLRVLYDQEFYWSIPRDSNRNLDGLDLRTRYEHEVGVGNEVAIGHLDGSCSVLEMMVALAIRMETEIMHDDDIGDRTMDWFWNMIGSLGLSDQRNESFDEWKVREIVELFLERKYQRDGRGGLFTCNEIRKDMRKVEIWYQMNYWLDENFQFVF